MNDFTKAELILLEFSLTQEIMNTCPEKHDTHPLRVKLESMVDNYCEHDFHPVLGQFQIESCHKCMRVK